VQGQFVGSARASAHCTLAGGIIHITPRPTDRPPPPPPARAGAPPALASSRSVAVKLHIPPRPCPKALLARDGNGGLVGDAVGGPGRDGAQGWVVVFDPRHARSVVIPPAPVPLKSPTNHTRQPGKWHPEQPTPGADRLTEASAGTALPHCSPALLSRTARAPPRGRQ
jgi:hypothetical protein